MPVRAWSPARTYVRGRDRFADGRGGAGALEREVTAEGLAEDVQRQAGAFRADVRACGRFSATVVPPTVKVRLTAAACVLTETEIVAAEGDAGRKRDRAGDATCDPGAAATARPSRS